MDSNIKRIEITMIAICVIVNISENPGPKENGGTLMFLYYPYIMTRTSRLACHSSYSTVMGDTLSVSL